MNKAGNSFIIGITGGSGSGKTTFLNELRERFSEDELCVLSQDNYYRERENQRIDEEGVCNFDRLESFYLEDFERDIVQLVSGETVSRQEYVYNNPNAPVRMLQFKPAPVILVEGLFVFDSEKIRKMLDLSVFVHAHEVKKVIRRIRRDGIERNYPIDDVLYRYEHHVLPSFESHIKPIRESADIIINNNYSMDSALKVFESFIRQQLVR